MATQDGNSIRIFSSNQDVRQQQLFSLISVLCAPRQSHPNSDLCRLIVDSRLSWAFEPIDASTSWIYLREAAHAHQVAGCLIITAA